MLVCFAVFLTAQVVAPDSIFGINGLVKTPLYDSYGNPYGNNVLLLSNGEVVTVGAGSDSIYLPTVEKFGNNGVLDPSFTQIFPKLSESSLGLSDQQDGKLLVTGRESVDPFNVSVYRLHANGKADTTFGIGGFSLLSEKPFDNIIPMELSTGKIIVFGDETFFNADINVFVSQLHSNGVVDTTFGEDGYFRFGLSDKRILITAGVEQPDGKLVFAGMASWNLFMIRLNPDGTRDLSFGTDGYLIDPMPEGGEAYGLALQPDGKIVVCGYGEPSYQPTVARYHPNGSRDSTFGNQGVVFFTEIPKYTEGIGIEVLPNGNTLVGISNFYGKNFYVAQLLPSGARDTTFGINGVYEYVNNNFRARAMDRLANLLAVSGREESSNNPKILLLRLVLDLNVGTINPNTATTPTLSIYPNPISEQFNMQFELTQQALVSIQLFDMQGRLVQSLQQNQSFEIGEHTINLSCPEQLPSGNYVLTLEVAGEKRTSVQIFKH